MVLADQVMIPFLIVNWLHLILGQFLLQLDQNFLL